jgi:hypothetical protein
MEELKLNNERFREEDEDDFQDDNQEEDQDEVCNLLIC